MTSELRLREIAGYLSLLRPLQVGYNAVKKLEIVSLTPMLAQSLFSSQVMHGLRGVSPSR